ncbi:hypothetical protein CRG98_021119 [Punica granatum]|uniref:Uncharacterized protein n=1 Tax=Punica granatum TaxID=22663 RepID=A0A2I0JSP4_PUNGR|nr:hypothetical protein CRG98_021119 [Punica granatum]
MELRQTKFIVHYPGNSSGHLQLGKTDSKTLLGFPSNLRRAENAVFDGNAYPEIGSIRDSFRKNDHHSHLRGSVRSREPLTLPQNSIGRLRGDVRPDLCQTGLKFQTCFVFSDLCRDVRVDPITLGPNDHHSHLWGSVRSQEPLTLPQNSIGSFCGDVRPDLCQSGCSVLQQGLFVHFGSV